MRKGEVRRQDKEKTVKELQDLHLEDIQLKLGVDRDSVHFLENYTETRKRP